MFLQHLTRYNIPSSTISIALPKHARNLFGKMPTPTLPTSPSYCTQSNPPHPILSPSIALTITSNNREINRLLRSGLLTHAVQLFNSMPHLDVVSYNSIIAGYTRSSHPQQAISQFLNMLASGIHESPLTFPPLLSACSLTHGRQLHSRTVSLGFASNQFIGSALINLYMRESSPDAALRVFCTLPERTIAARNSVLRGYCELGLTDELFSFFRLEQDAELDGVSYSYLLRGCCCDPRLDEGRQLHCHFVKAGWTPSNSFLLNVLVDLYSTAGELIDARRSIDCIPVSEVISWNSMVSVCAGNGCSMEAIGYFHTMLSHSMRPSVRSFVRLLNLSSKSCNLSLGLQIHAFVYKMGFSCSSVFVQSALIDMYGKCSDIRSSVLFFNEIPERGLECCNSLITAFLCCNLSEDAAEMFGLMIDEGLRPDHVSVSAVLKALSGSLYGCQMLHCYAVKSGVEENEAISCSLIDAYGKSGHCGLSRAIFDTMVDPSMISFSAIIAALGRNGMAGEGMELLNEMIKKGVKPDSVTLLSVLAGCDHLGMVEEGRSVLASMKMVHGVEPDRRHYACMVSLLGRAGLVEEAMEIARSHCDPKMWSSLLHNCRVQGNERIGRKAADALMELQLQASATCLQVERFYSDIADVNGLAVRVRQNLPDCPGKELRCSSNEEQRLPAYEMC